MLYHIDPLKLDFEAMIEKKVTLPGGRFGLILDRTYFYPTGGGQEHDRGSIGEAQVLDVYKEGEEPVIMHVVDRDLPLGTVSAHIDANHRQRAMQHHTAQHLLSHCFLHLLQAATVSANINVDSPSTLDLATEEISKNDLKLVEDLANAAIYENRPVKASFVTPKQAQKLPLRRPPAVHEDIRIIEIEGYDTAACGGTHVSHTGEIGLIKITRTERVNDKLRIHFIAGWQALEVLRGYFESLTALATQMNLHPLEVTEAFLRLSEQLKGTQRELQTLRLERIGHEAGELIQKSQPLGERRLVVTSYEGRPVPELRLLAEELRKFAGCVAFLATFDGEKLSMVATCAPDSGLSAQELLRQALQPIGGRGGGDRSIAQGGGAATAEQVQSLLPTLRSLVPGG